MARPAIYIETSVVSYLVARPCRDLIVAAHQQLTSAWWHNHSAEYEMFTSQLVLDEAKAGDPEIASKRLAALEGVSLLQISDAAIDLADKLIKANAVPQKAAQDSLHIAIACVNGMDYLLTWNCKHIANARMRSKIDKVCREAGFIPPIICTPEELED